MEKRDADARRVLLSSGNMNVEQPSWGGLHAMPAAPDALSEPAAGLGTVTLFHIVPPSVKLEIKTKLPLFACKVEERPPSDSVKEYEAGRLTDERCIC
jgi:hypothetical protein